MIKRTVIAAIAIFALTSTSAYSSARPDAPTTNGKVQGIANMEAVRLAALFDSLAEQTAQILNNPQGNAENLEMYIDTIRRITTYSDSKQALNEADLNLLVDAFYNFVQAGGEPISKDDIRADLSRFSTVGGVAEYLSSALNEGLSEAE